jgi:hypothetical protein
MLIDYNNYNYSNNYNYYYLPTSLPTSLPYPTLPTYY